MFTFGDEEDAIKFMPLKQTKNGHIAVDLCQASTSLDRFSEFVKQQFGLRVPQDEKRCT